MLIGMAAHFLVVEDYAPLAQTLASAARCVGDVRVAMTVGDGFSKLAERRDWAGFIIDIMLPDGNGLDVLERARDLGCEAPALVLSAHQEKRFINRAFALNGRYLVKPADPLRILSFLSDAARIVHSGRAIEEWEHLYSLTKTEVAILRAAAEGSHRDQLAFERGIDTITLKTHVHNLLKKTGDPSLLAAAARLLRDRER